MASTPPRRFRIGRRARDAAAGETLLATLARQGLPNVVRSVRYHRPRAPFCGLGHCTGCLVRVNGRPNVRACRHIVAEGDRVETENAWPSPRLDLLGATDLLLPNGLDTLHGFRRPAFATRLYHRLIRRLAGFGAPPDPAPTISPPVPTTRRKVDVVVVGAGPTGRSAATTLVRRGVRPLLVDRSFDPPEVPGADLLPATTVTFLPPPTPGTPRPFALLGFEESGRGVSIRANAVVLATGGYDAALLFEGSDRPGVMAADLVLRLAPEGGRLPFGRAVVVGGGTRTREMLDRLGSAATAVVAPGEIAPEVVRRAVELDVPLYPRSLVVRATGRSRVRALELRTRGREGRSSLRCDAVVLAHRRLPNSQLLFQAGARMAWRPAPGAYYAVTDAAGGTTVPGLYVAGALAGVSGEERLASGERAALGAAGGTPVTVADGPAVGAPRSELEGYYRELLNERRKGKWVVCPCEDVLLSELETAVASGYRGIEVVKRFTGIGTGLCQGRYCLPEAILLLANLEGRPPPEVGYITQRPPLVPTPLSALAGLRDEFGKETVA